VALRLELRGSLQCFGTGHFACFWAVPMLQLFTWNHRH